MLPGPATTEDGTRATTARASAGTCREYTAIRQHHDKKRFAFDATGTLIRANQGHSVDIDLQLEPVEPPAVLYHGTGHGSADSIARQGLLRMSRHRVHLSPDPETARRVGARHGRPVIFTVDAAAMHQAGHLFCRSENGVWLVDHVPPEYLRRL